MKRKSRIILGLNSGTSADGVDAAACEITGRGLNMRVRVIGHYARRYPAELHERLLAVMAPAETQTEEICRLHSEVGRVFAQTAAAAVKKFALQRVDLVGSHGQTICHLPPRQARSRNTTGRRKRSGAGRHAFTARSRRMSASGRVSMSSAGARSAAHGKATLRPLTPGTLQIGDATQIALALNAPVVSDFRHADMAAGGQGAPLVPWTDYVLFRHSKRGRVIQNIGGIANLTFIPAGAETEDVVAFDTGPGNMLLDGLVRHFTNGIESFDRDGRLAREGKLHRSLFRAMLKHPYLCKPPPKSCGREEFGDAYLQALLRRYKKSNIPLRDWLATAATVATGSINFAYKFQLVRWEDGQTLDEVILCGGGARNRTLVQQLRRFVTANGEIDIPFSTTDDYGIPIQAKECVSFAMLATACADRVPANLPRVTGAKRSVVLGQLYHPID